MRLFIMALIATIIFSVVTAFAADTENFLFYNTVRLEVGESLVLKGVRSSDCGDKAPRWGGIRLKLPRSKTGSYSNGGIGTVNSISCGGKVAARGVKFTAKKAGKEKLKIFGDVVKITVR